MKALSIALLGLVSIAICRGADPIANLKRDAAACTKAWDRADYPGFLSCLADPVTTGPKARDIALTGIKDLFDYLEYLGLKSLKVTVGEPGKLRTAGNFSASIVPVTAIMEGPGGKIVAPSHVLAVSRNRGDAWKFVILYQRSNSELNALFPEFQGKFEIPRPTPPVIEPNPTGPTRGPGP